MVFDSEVVFRFAKEVEFFRHANRLDFVDSFYLADDFAFFDQLVVFFAIVPVRHIVDWICRMACLSYFPSW